MAQTPFICTALIGVILSSWSLAVLERLFVTAPYFFNWGGCFKTSEFDIPIGRLI